MWNGDYLFLLRNMIVKDFKIRYRNMSLGVFWSLLNPLVMMGVLTFVFTKIFPNTQTKNFAVFVLCGLVPYNFLSTAWGAGTTSIMNNAGLIKRVPVPREVVPIAAVLSNCVHLGIQILLLLAATLAFGNTINVYWLWLPLVWAMEIIFVCGIALITSAFDVYIRDTRYVVESTITVMFWLVPIFYSFEIIPQQYHSVYQYNPVAALVLCLRNILLDSKPPHPETLLKLMLVSVVTFVMGWAIFGRMKQRFFDYL